MSAKEMFNELGYDYEKKNNVIEYIKEDNENDVYIGFIQNKLDEDVEVQITIPTGYHSYFFSLDEINAINKQVEELKGNN